MEARPQLVSFFGNGELRLTNFGPRTLERDKRSLEEPSGLITQVEE
jgi:hypothetical protein